MDKQVKNFKTGWVWVVFRRDLESDRGLWHLQGIATYETEAIEMAVDHTYIIGPIPLGVSLPTETIEWIGSYMPYNQGDKK